MRWMWIDQITHFEADRRLVAVKNVSLAEEHLHQHFAAGPDGPACPVMPMSLMVEGMAQTAGVLVGSVNRFREKVILAKVNDARIDREVIPGQTIRYDATIERMDAAGASTMGVIDVLDHRRGSWERIGEISLMFSHIDANRSGLQFPEHNFVFSDNFRLILEQAGLGSLAD